jgi:hypothetical protein
MKAMTLPMPVASPAKRVSPKAIQKGPSSMAVYPKPERDWIASRRFEVPASAREGTKE